MKKYKTYSNVMLVTLIFGLLLGFWIVFWMVYGTLSGAISNEKIDSFVVIIGILMIIVDLCLLSEVFRKIKISDDCISRKTFFLKEKKIFFSEILNGRFFLMKCRKSV